MDSPYFARKEHIILARRKGPRVDIWISYTRQAGLLQIHVVLNQYRNFFHQEYRFPFLHQIQHPYRAATSRR